MQRVVFDYGRLAALVTAGEIFEVKIRARQIWADATFPRGFFAFPGTPHGTPIPVTPGGVCTSPSGYVERWFLKFGPTRTEIPLLRNAAGAMGYNVWGALNSYGNIVPLAKIWSGTYTSLQDEPVSPPVYGGSAVRINLEPGTGAVWVPIAQFCPYGCNGLSLRVIATTIDDGDARDVHPNLGYWDISAVRMPVNQYTDPPRSYVALGCSGTGGSCELYASWCEPGRMEPNDALLFTPHAGGAGTYCYLNAEIFPRQDNPSEPFTAILRSTNFNEAQATDAFAYWLARQEGMRPSRAEFTADGDLTAGTAVIRSVFEHDNTMIDEWDCTNLSGMVVRETSPTGAYSLEIDDGVGTLDAVRVYLRE